MKAIAIIGSGFGDEGKGLMTDFICHNLIEKGLSVTNIRHNGGSQAGHSVHTEDSHHVFHHFGAGTLAGASVFLSEHFIHNPFVWNTEDEQLGSSYSSTIDPRGVVTTPWDMLINREVETARGAARHGSVGLGIYETVVRSESNFGLRVKDLCIPSIRNDIIQKIRNEWFFTRMNDLGVVPSNKCRDTAVSAGLLYAFESVCEKFIASNTISRVPPAHEIVVFEGAQGLLLDSENTEFAPFLTPSRTGLANILKLSTDLRITSLEVIYVTRAYTTRHGAGPLPHEDPTLTICDTTNIPHEWQGTLRFSHLDLDLISKAIQKDLAEARSLSRMKISAKMAVTCLDQVGTHLNFWLDNKLQTERLPEALQTIGEITGCPVVYTSVGPNRMHVAQRTHLYKELVR